MECELVLSVKSNLLGFNILIDLFCCQKERISIFSIDVIVPELK